MHHCTCAQTNYDRIQGFRLIGKQHDIFRLVSLGTVSKYDLPPKLFGIACDLLRNNINKYSLFRRFPNFFDSRYVRVLSKNVKASYNC